MKQGEPAENGTGPVAPGPHPRRGHLERGPRQRPLPGGSGAVGGMRNGGGTLLRFSECRKTVKTPSTGRKRVTRGTQEGFLSFSIGSFQNFFKGLKTCSGWRKHFFDSLRPGGQPPGPSRFSDFWESAFYFCRPFTQAPYLSTLAWASAASLPWVRM